MKAKFYEPEVGKLGIRFEPETQDEVLLLKIFTDRAPAGSHFEFRNWAYNEPGKPQYDDRSTMTSASGFIVEGYSDPDLYTQGAAEVFGHEPTKEERERFKRAFYKTAYGFKPKES